tara:strand:- start:374 stop:1066 length:693 start_codon:yes stop_codon:yes gene_type:complete
MVFKKGNPGCACCCPCYYFEGNGGNNRPLTEKETVAYSTTASQGGKSAEFEGNGYFERERHWCFTPYGKTTWTVSFDMKVVTLPATDQSQYMGLVTRGSFDGSNMTGEWGIFYKAVDTGPTVVFVIKTTTAPNLLPQQPGPPTVYGFAINDESGAGTNGFNTLSWTIGPEKTSTAVANDQTIENPYTGELAYEDTALLVGKNTGQLKLGQDSTDGDGGKILIDNLCFDYT